MLEAGLVCADTSQHKAVEPTAAAKMRRPIRRAAGVCRFHMDPLCEDQFVDKG